MKSLSMILTLNTCLFVSRDVGLWKRLYTTYIRPHLEYAIQAWNPYTKKDIKTLEKVQRRTTKVPNLLKHLSYDERLKNLYLATLDVRRERGLDTTLQNREWNQPG